MFLTFYAIQKLNRKTNYFLVKFTISDGIVNSWGDYGWNSKIYPIRKMIENFIKNQVGKWDFAYYPVSDYMSKTYAYEHCNTIYA